jgi:tetratricopeptide (TPR) repeat protein
MRFRRREEISPVTQAVTLFLVAIILFFELHLLYAWLRPLPCILASVALLISAAALYGPVFLSMGSQAVVGLVMPDIDSSLDEPDLASAEALERVGEYDAAAGEYMTLARMHPRDARIALRMGNCLMHADRPEEAAEAFEKGLRLTSDADQALPVVNRLVDLYTRQLERPERARELLSAFVDRYPDAKYAGSARRRLERLRTC